MAVRLVIHMEAKPGKGAEYMKLMNARCAEMRQDAGCQEFQIFQDASDPDKFVLLELWESQEALDAHAKLNSQRGPVPGMAEVRGDGPGAREDYEYNRTR